MKRDLSRYLWNDGGSASEDGTRRSTRRHFLAAAAGVGLGAAGVRLGGSAIDRSPASRNGGEDDVEAAGADEDAGEDTERARSPADTPVIGANLNGRPHRLRDNLELIHASDTTWVRAFLDVRKKLTSGIPPRDDPDVLALRRAAREGNCKLIVSLKWDFRAAWNDKEPMNVPPPGSDLERELCQCAVRYLGDIGAPIDVVVLGNEPMWETLDDDIKVDDPPIVRFTKNAKDHLVRHGDHGDPSYLVGAFNRAHNDNTRNQRFPHFHREMFDMVREDEDVDGIDLHIHYGAFHQAEKMVAVAREEVPDGTIVATEFSPVWRYDRNIDTPINEFETGERFARNYDLPVTTTPVEYFEYAKRNPRPPEELADFYDAMPWYNVNHVEDMYALFADYDVSVGTFGFLQSLGMRTEDWTRSWTPFHINFLFQPALLQTDHGIENTAHPHYIEDYRKRAVRSGEDDS